MTPVILTELLAHNDFRVHPAKIMTRSFRTDQGYTLEWYPPHLFRITIPQHVGQEVGPNNPLHERWLAHTNIQSWTPATGQEIKLIDDSLKPIVHGIIENYKALMQLSADMRALTESLTAQAKSLKSSTNSK